MAPQVFLDVFPLWAVFGGTFVSILLALEIGYRLGRWRRSRANQEKDAPIGAMVAAELGLLAFLLAFTFGIAASRFDERRRILLDEVNAIGTSYLRAGLLPDPHRSEAQRLLRQYVDVRLSATRTGMLKEGIMHSTDLHKQLWVEATAVAEKDTRSIPVGLFVESINAVIDIHALRLQAGVRSRIPGTLWAVLFPITLLSFGAMGYHGGLSGTTRSPATLTVALAFAAVIWLVVDLERPHQGLLRVSQQPMIDLRESMTTSSTTQAADDPANP